ncbi:MAG: hypothetical protein RBT34_06920 [Anaerolineaceae bacterium]|nr:hypothetical protein [Anaerolineaceae bacterium]
MDKACLAEIELVKDAHFRQIVVLVRALAAQCDANVQRGGFFCATDACRWRFGMSASGSGVRRC